MNSLWRMLEDWATHQDYFWFLALLAWGGVLGAELRRNEKTGTPSAQRWLMALAACHALGALLELLLLAQNILMPYTRLDAAMGAAQAGGTAALVWAWTAGAPRAAVLRPLAAMVLATLAVARLRFPVEAGLALAALQAGAILGVLRRSPQLMPVGAASLLVFLPLVATHGPWAYAIQHGRRSTDWSYFSLAAAGVSILAGTVLATAAWRRRLQQAVADVPPGGTFRRDLRWAVVALVAWLVGGVLLAVWYGRLARRAFEENLLRRVEIGILALDPRALTEALGPELRITAIRALRYPNGQAVDVATVPRTRLPVYAALRTQLARLREKNPDFRYLYIATWRQGQMLVLNSESRQADNVRHVIHHAATAEDLVRLAARESFLEGPLRTTWGPQFSAKAPLFHPATGQLLGWLVADVEATRWTVTFTQARLQTMALVGAGVGLWTLAVAYRLRREARDTAERKAAAAAAADRMKSAFLAQVSHELRTPIQSVLGYGELLAAAPLSELHRGWLAALRSHGGVMLRLVNDLIDLGALQSGAFQLEPAPVELPALVADCAAALQPAFAGKELAFSTAIGPDVPVWVRADGVRLRQVLLNLLTNAVKFTAAGTITLTVRRRGDGQIEFVIADTGSGIPVALRSRLFQPFARLDPATSGGSGLGLALVQGLCGVMGGTVTLDEASERGATFIARLPLPACEPLLAAASDAPFASNNFAGMRVLVAEDNTLVRELLIAYLAENGAEVMVAVDGPSALALARERSPDVLLLDIALPGLDGIAVAEALRRVGPPDLRIIGLSAHASRLDETRARAAGMDEFLAKPVSLSRLGRALTGHVRGRPGAAISAVNGLAEPLRSRLTAQFAHETPRLLEEMRIALAAADWPQLRNRAHYLKNSADILGAIALQDACRQLAALDEHADAATARRLLAAVEGAIPGNFPILAGAPAADRN